jgi:hypothetical protein
MRAILEQRMDVPGSFGAVGSDREEDASAGRKRTTARILTRTI